MGLDAFLIVFEGNREAFYAGELVRGHVVVAFDEKKKVKSENSFALYRIILYTHVRV